MDVLLINPPDIKLKRYYTFILPPIGLSYIASVLERGGFNVKILDAYALKYTWKDLEHFLENKFFDIIGITAMTPTKNRSYKTARIARKHCKWLFMGGPHPSIYPKECLEECPEIDLIVLGESEITCQKLFKRIYEKRGFEKIDGIGYKEKGNVVLRMPKKLIKNLDKLPFPARHLLPMERYTYPISKYKNVDVLITSRGCPFNCTFCFKFMFGNKYRARSAKNVVDEIEESAKKYGIKSFIFYDDLFTFNSKRVVEICDEILRRRLKIEWKCEGRVNIVKEDVLEKMKKAGCELIAYGVESVHQKSLDFYNKGTTPEIIRDAFKKTKKAGIDTLAYLIIGGLENEKEAYETIRFAKEIRATYIQVGVLTVMKGSKLYEIAKEKGWIKTIKYTGGLYSDFDTRNIIDIGNNISSDEWDRILKRCYIMFLLDYRYIIKSILRIRSIHQLKTFILTSFELSGILKGI